MERAKGSSARPASVGSTLRVVRVNSLVPSSTSRLRIAADSPDWETPVTYGLSACGFHSVDWSASDACSVAGATPRWRRAGPMGSAGSSSCAVIR
jgi:hypothetical protein